MLIKISVVIALMLGGLFTVAALQPADFKISRSITIDAPPVPVFAKVYDFHFWPDWSPWAKIDPEMKVVFRGPRNGAGASYSWKGNKNVGEGKMFMTKAHPAQSIDIQIDFLKPMKASNQVQFLFEVTAPHTTKVTWTMAGKKNLFSKLFFLFADMERLLGPDFEKGLAQLKSVVEAK